MWPAYLDKVSKGCHKQLWDKKGGIQVVRQNSKVNGLVSHVIQGPHQDQSVARLDKKLEGHAT